MVFGLIVVGVTFCFVFVLLRGAPYLPSLSPQIKVAIELSGLSKGDTLLELGCGDGKVILFAAKQGINVVGYELNPILVLLSRIRTYRYRKNVKIIWGDFWQKNWPDADAIFVFLLPKYMKKLNTKIDQKASKPINLVSFAFEIPDRQAIETKNGIFLYKYK